MRVCIRCEAAVADPNFQCAVCGFVPPVQREIPVLAPELDSQLDDYPSDYFDVLKELEDGHFWFENRNRLVQWALARFFPDAASFLELGCGTGFVLRGVAEDNPRLRLTGGDAATAALVHARARVPNASFLQVDARELPFRSEMDIIGAFDVIEHIEEDVEVLQEMRRALKPNGGVVLTVPQHQFLWSMADEHARHKRRYSRRELVEKVRCAGFQILYVGSFVSLLLPAMLAVRLRKRNAGIGGYDPSAEFRIHRGLNRALRAILRLEQWVIRAGMTLPAGGSLLVVAQVAPDQGR